MQIDYDPARISYEDLLEVFWSGHRPEYYVTSTQYMPILFFHNADQEQAARLSLSEIEESGTPVYTLIRPYERFYLAEDYHQKYYVQRHPDLVAELKAPYRDFASFVDSTAAARVNSYLGGYGDRSSLEREIDRLGLSPAAQDKLRTIVN